MSLQALSDYVIYSKYSHFLPEKKRRETWEEVMNRVFSMHEKKYKKQLDENKEFKQLFEETKQAAKDKKVIGSQRALQFGSPDESFGILKKNEKIFNCSGTLIDRPRVFQEIGFVLLNGCGAGYSVQYHHVSKLPLISIRNKGEKKYVIEDSIEGWSNAWGVLINSYFINGVYPEYEGYKVEFDFSKIRPEGALIAGQFKAPGHKPLEKSLNKIRSILDKIISGGENKLSPLNVHDIICHIADSILSGGIRRSALICLFSLEDNEMAKCKTGNWFEENPQRGRSNNSVALYRGKTTEKQFGEIYKNIKEYGEPGFYFVDDEAINQITNPCQPKWAPILTKTGIKPLSDINENDEIWSESGWTKVLKKWSTGVKKVYRYGTTCGAFYGTENHRVVSEGKKIEAQNAESIDILSGEYNSDIILDNQDIIDGIVFGYGSVHEASNNLIYLCVGQDDQDYFSSEVKDYIKEYRPGLSPYAHEVKTDIRYDELPLTYLRSIPDRYVYGSKSKVCGFLRGLYTANGSFTGGRVTLKASSFKVIEKVQLMLSSVGISSYYTTNKATNVKFSNGEYLCRQSYDLNITSDKEKFISIIGYIQKYKVDKVISFIENSNKSSKKKKTYDIISVDLISEEEVFDITVDNPSHTYWTGGVNVSNCCEIGFWPVLDTGESGISFCNLSEINGFFCKTKEDFLLACKYASFMGTLQAGYNSMPYLGEVTEKILNKESLLGVSITGWMDSPDILFNEQNLKDGVKIVKEINELVSKIIGISPAARLTCTKPSGSASSMLMTGSGIHAQHSKRFLRRVQTNKKEFSGKAMKKKNPISVEESVWSTNRSDNVISFPCEVSDKALTKKDLSAIQFLEKVKFAYQNWVIPGTNRELGLNKHTTHNISVTVSVKDSEWDEVRDYIYNNKNYFSGISLLSTSGDLDYNQAPFVEVLMPQELVEKYGNGVPLASGLIVDGLHAFESLWVACDAALGVGEKLEDKVDPVEPKKPRKVKGITEKSHANALANYAIELNLYYQDKGEYNTIELKKDWVRRAKQFANRYFDGDIKKMTYCLKQVSVYKDYMDIKREWKNIDWSTIKEDSQEFVNVDTLGAIACSGGQCNNV